MLSIIIPQGNYNLDLLETCLNSINEQANYNFSNLEIIIVQDHTTLNLKQYSNLNIKLINNKYEQGAGNSRQSGLEASRGDFIYFVDSDDELDSKHALWYINECLKQPYLFYNFKNYNERSNMLMDFKYMSLYSCVFKKEIIDKYNIRFINTKVYEDVNFINKYVFAINLDHMANCFDVPLYFYKNNVNSITYQNRNDNETFNCDIKNVLDTEDFINKHNIATPEVQASFLNFAFIRLYFEAIKSDNLTDLKALQEFVKRNKANYLRLNKPSREAVLKAFNKPTTLDTIENYYFN